MVQWGQPVSRDPGPVSASDSHEFVAGAYLLAGSEIHEMIKLKAKRANLPED
jgi:hypothetical protein